VIESAWLSHLEDVTLHWGVSADQDYYPVSGVTIEHDRLPGRTLTFNARPHDEAGSAKLLTSIFDVLLGRAVEWDKAAA
jgi:hypothetical protein